MAQDQMTVAMLSHFFVYNPLFGPTEETEQLKLLFHYPSDLPMDHKLKNVGLSEALVNFSRYARPACGVPSLSLFPSNSLCLLRHAAVGRCRTFSPDRPCEVVHTVKRRMVFYNPEPNYWMVMVRDLAEADRAALFVVLTNLYAFFSRNWHVVH